jgi:hypothetical protein
VYVEPGFCAFGHLNGCLLPFIALSAEGRYLRVVVTPDKNRKGRDQLIALIGHELQHALEVLQQPEIIDVTTMLAWYNRVGSPLKDRTGYETSAARAAGDSVFTELQRNRAPAK